MTKEKERDNTLRGERNFLKAEAKDWLKKEWDWLTESEIDLIDESREALEALVRKHFGEADWQEEWARFEALFSGIDAETRHGPKGPVDDRERDQRQRGPGAE
ncbi:MAG TPA: hypothetical protein GXZ89_05085 [Fastidiosipila sp.]|nr:hypothetical protein [Fastidiosipila sp.]